MYATRTTFAATTAVMAAKVELPGMECKLRSLSRKGGKICERRTIPYVLLRGEIRCNWDDTERETEDNELVQYSRAVGGTCHEWQKQSGRNRKAGLLPSLTHPRRSAYKPVQKHRVHSFFAGSRCRGGLGQALGVYRARTTPVYTPLRSCGA